ncbi:hypothetical protein LVD13_09445 [Flavobacteriaceae bacterium D16]|nr:hypothetical protein [Flavobacteriaceae bacterium D16]
MLKYIFLSIFLCSLLITSAQDNNDPDSDVHRFRIGLKAGIPNIVGGNAEFVLPILDNHLAPYIDYSTFSIDVDDVDTSFNFFEIGTNVYFNNKGKGLYASISYGSFNLEGTYTDAETVDGELFEGEASGEIDITTVNLKLGAKLGNKFYFRVEVGYGMGDIPEEVIITGTVNGQTEEGVEEIPDIPGIGDSGLLVANLGFGFAF